MILDLYSKRLKRERGEEIDVYTYDELSEKFRNQVNYILEDCISNKSSVWELSSEYMCREYGLCPLVDDDSCIDKDYKYKCMRFVEVADTIAVLDFIEIVFKVEREYRPVNRPSVNRRPLIKEKMTINEAIEELNGRFKENGLGYEYVNNQIIRIDRKYTHNNIIKPAIRLLYESDFQGANDEFMEAHERYKEGKFKESIVSAEKAFESTMKTICKLKKISYDKENASGLINLLFDKGFIPTEVKSHFEGLNGVLKHTLKSGLPTIRNGNGGHGQGETVVEVPEEYVIYALNLTATNIVFLVDLYKTNN